MRTVEVAALLLVLAGLPSVRASAASSEAAASVAESFAEQAGSMLLRDGCAEQGRWNAALRTASDRVAALAVSREENERAQRLLRTRSRKRLSLLVCSKDVSDLDVPELRRLEDCMKRKQDVC